MAILLGTIKIVHHNKIYMHKYVHGYIHAYTCILIFSIYINTYIDTNNITYVCCNRDYRTRES